MTSIIRFAVFTLIIAVIAWGLAIFTAWWIGMFLMTMHVIALAAGYLHMIAENYIID